MSQNSPVGLFEDFKKSNIAYLQEKYIAILKELHYIQGVSKYYNGLTPKDYSTFEELYSTIENFNLYIKSIYNHQNYGIAILENSKSLYEFIIFFDIQNYKIVESLNFFASLHKKVLQTIQESMPHHIPSASTNKRYSSKVLSDFLQYHANMLYSDLVGKEFTAVDSSLKLYWEHIDNYKLENDNSFSFNEHINLNFISHSFYYHDIVWTIPTLIDKEVVLFAIEDDKYSYVRNHMQEVIRKEVENCIDKYENDLSDTEGKHKDDFLYTFKKIFANSKAFVNELISDMISFIIYGEPYLISFLHETLGREFGRQHYCEKSDNVIPFVELNANPIRDTLIMRQYLLISLYFILISNKTIKISESAEINNYLELAHQFLKFLAKDELNNNEAMEKVLFDKKVYLATEDTNETAFASRVAYTAIMADIAKALDNKMYEFFRECSHEIPRNIGNEDLFIRDSENKISYILWEERFKSIYCNYSLPHKSILRRLMLQKNNILQQCGFDFKPFTLEFKKDIQIGKMTDDYIGFGLFDQIKICKKDEYVSINTEISDLFKAKKKFFVHKHSLLHLKSYTKNKDKLGIYDLYMLISLKDSMNMDSLVVIDEWCNRLKTNVKFYKSLGAQDIVLHFECESKQDIWYMLNKTRENNMKLISKTYSIVATKNNLSTYDEELDIKIMCTSSSMDSVAKLPKLLQDHIKSINCKTYKNFLNKIEINDTIGFRTYEINFYNIKLNKLEKIINFLKSKDSSLQIEFYFIKNEKFNI